MKETCKCRMRGIEESESKTDPKYSLIWKIGKHIYTYIEEQKETLAWKCFIYLMQHKVVLGLKYKVQSMKTSIYVYKIF